MNLIEQNTQVNPCFVKRISLLYLKANNGKILGYVTTDDGLQINVKGSLLSNEKKQNYEV